MVFNETKRRVGPAVAYSVSGFKKLNLPAPTVMSFAPEDWVEIKHNFSCLEGYFTLEGELVVGGVTLKCDDE
jgi:hypothetical protein